MAKSKGKVVAKVIPVKAPPKPVVTPKPAAVATPKPAAVATPKPAAAPVNPYTKYGLQTQEQIRQQDTAARNAYAANLRTQANQQIAGNNQQYDKAQNANYVNYMMAQRALPAQMARLGLSGGASESNMLRLQTNYANMRGNTEAQRSAANSSVTQNMNNTLANYNLQQDQLLNDRLTKNASDLYARQIDERNRQLEQQKFALEKQQYEQTVKDNAYTKAFERANANASQYGSVKDVNKALKSLEKKPAKKRSQYEKLLISALRARKSAVKALEKENTAKTVSKTKKSGDSTTTTTKKVYAKGKAKAKSKAKAKKGKKK